MGPHFFKCGKCPRPQPLHPRPRRLQWGRTFSSAESRQSAVRQPLREKALQWGRTFSSAESPFSESNDISILSRFNGAALFQVRKVFQADLPFSAQSLLQWGRTFSSAESSKLANSPTRQNAKLQWGRTFSSAESEYWESHFRRTIPRLQWGRTFSSAESNPLHRFVALALTSFNGAALFQVRKETKKAPPQMRRGWLQWGRTFSSAERTGCGALRSCPR